MSSTSSNCPQCGSPLPAGHPSALCPACLLQLGFESRDPDASTAAYQPKFLMPTPEELAPRFPQLEILERIGHGGMGVVYRARQKELDRIVALKILRPDFGSTAGFAERFQREARALAKLNHPHIITVHDFGRSDDLFYFVMEFIDGVNLRQLEQTAQLSPQQALSLVPQVCSALQYAHEQGVVHRDIKPENILVTRDGRVKIADFGLAKLAGHAEQPHLTGTWQVMGTPHYMAPEQVERPTEVDHRADIFSLGVVFYEMLTGELPLGRFPLPSHKAQIDVRLDDVVLRALEKEPERRYQHATEVQTDLEQIRQSSVPRPTPAGTASSPDEPHSQNARQFAAIGLGAASLLELAWAFFLIADHEEYGLLVLPIALLSLATALQAYFARNHTLVVVGCWLSFIPVSWLWPFKVAAAIILLLELRKPASRSAFQTVSWFGRQSGQPLGDWWRNAQRTGHHAAATLHRQLGQLPKHTTIAGQRVWSLVRHPVVWATLVFVIGTAFWSLYCVTASLGLMEAMAESHRRIRQPYDRDWLETTTAVITCLCWVIGEVVLVLEGLRALSGTPDGASRIAGAQTALLGAATGAGGAGVLLLVASAFDNFARLMFTHPSQYGSPLGLVQLGWAEVLFAVLCVLAAVLLTWTVMRWVTRFLLLLSLVFPVGAAIAALAAPDTPKPMLITLLPIVLSLPALTWGLWATRRAERRIVAPMASPLAVV